MSRNCSATDTTGTESEVIPIMPLRVLTPVASAVPAAVESVMSFEAE